MTEQETQNSPTSPNAFGYTRLADFMAWDPPTASFHRFGSLNAMNLLGMQAELCSLQEELELNAKNNEKRGPEHRRLQCDWTSLDSGQPESEERKNLLMKVRSKLDEYSALRMAALQGVKGTVAF